MAKISLAIRDMVVIAGDNDDPEKKVLKNEVTG